MGRAPEPRRARIDPQHTQRLGDALARRSATSPANAADPSRQATTCAPREANGEAATSIEPVIRDAPDENARASVTGTSPAEHRQAEHHTAGSTAAGRAGSAGSPEADHAHAPGAERGNAGRFRFHAPSHHGRRWWFRRAQLRPPQRIMLIDLNTAVATYDASRTTIMRRIKQGDLTKHPAPDTHTAFRLDTTQLDRHFARRDQVPTPAVPQFDEERATDRSQAEAVELRRDVPALFLPRGMAERLVPPPHQLRAAMQRAFDAPRLPRLIARRR